MGREDLKGIFWIDRVRNAYIISVFLPGSVKIQVAVMDNLNIFDSYESARKVDKKMASNVIYNGGGN